MRSYLVILTVLLAVTVNAQSSESISSSYSDTVDKYRPKYHFTPEKNWMNDPNGMFFYEGEYHLFYQYNPYGNTWGHMSWGHAVSDDMINWEHLPVAIPEEDGIMIFSGSAVVDWNNSSGFSKNEEPPIVAVYTGFNEKTGVQQQSIAYSLDHGRTFHKYEGNPVLDINSRNFRDPKVFWFDADNKWVMVVALSEDRRIEFYESSDLKNWLKTGEFGPYGALNGVWECPDLFQLETEEGEKRWILEVDLGDGSIAGGSGGQYFIGEFDGDTFVAEEVLSTKAEPYLPVGDVIDDFESGFGFWSVHGSAFGSKPVSDHLEEQQQVNGFLGSGYINSFHGGDESTGHMISKEFTIDKPYINFLIGGGSKEAKAEVSLIINGKEVYSETGNNNENLIWATWMVDDFRGQKARLRVEDYATDGWGHINVDHFIQSDSPAYNVPEDALWLDYGKDFYAAVSWSDIPKSDGRRVWLGWMNNWQYAQEIPTVGWRSHMSIPRELGLRKTAKKFELTQKPVEEFGKYLEPLAVESRSNTVRVNRVLKSGLDDRFARLQFTVRESRLGKNPLELVLNNSDEEVWALLIKEESDFWHVQVRRSGKGNVDFNRKFPSIQEKRIEKNGDLDFDVIWDRSSVEVFADQGAVVFTNLVFPRTTDTSLEFYFTRKRKNIFSSLEISRGQR
jgi:beta-fructofuranosidase/levanase